jgi:hypothetical protein
MLFIHNDSYIWQTLPVVKLRINAGAQGDNPTAKPFIAFI